LRRETLDLCVPPLEVRAFHLAQLEPPHCRLVVSVCGSFVEVCCLAMTLGGFDHADSPRRGDGTREGGASWSRFGSAVLWSGRGLVRAMGGLRRSPRPDRREIPRPNVVRRHPFTKVVALILDSALL
jgi:hypothetical protein